MTFRNRAFELEIDSFLALPELPDGDPDARADLDIAECRVPDEPLPGGGQLGPFAWATADRLRLRVPEVARFEVQEGGAIVVEPDAGIDAASIRTFLLGSVLGAALLQRGLAILHGNAVAVAGGALVCLGSSGVGKSTLALGFHRRGYPVLADDVVALDEKAEVLPGIPRIKVWQDVADRLAIDTQALVPIRPDMRKFSLPLEVAGRRTPLPAQWIGVLTQGHVDRIEIEPLHGMAAFEAITDHFYRAGLVTCMGRDGEHLRLVGRLVRQARVVRVTRPIGGFTLDALVDRIIEDAGER